MNTTFQIVHTDTTQHESFISKFLFLYNQSHQHTCTYSLSHITHTVIIIIISPHKNNFKNTPNTLFFKIPDWPSISFLFHFYTTFYSSFLHNDLFKHVHLVTYSGVHSCNTSKWEAEKSKFEAHLDYIARSYLKNKAKQSKDVVLSTITPTGTTSYSSLVSST